MASISSNLTIIELINEGQDVLHHILSHGDVTSFIQLSSTCKELSNKQSIWNTISSHYNLSFNNNSEVKESVLNFLKTAILFNVYNVRQGDKKLEIRKYEICANPHMTVRQMIDFVYSKNCNAAETCRVTLTTPGEEAIVKVFSVVDSPKFQLTKQPQSQSVTEIACYVSSTIFDLKMCKDEEIMSIFSTNPKGGPFGIFDTPKDLSKWTWGQCNIPHYFQNAKKINPEIPLGLLKDQTGIIIG